MLKVCCNACKKPIKESQYAAHAGSRLFPHCYHSSESMKICLKSLGVENENSVDFSLAVILTCILFLLTGTVENI